MPGVKLIRASILPAVMAAALISTISAAPVTVTGRTVDETGVEVAYSPPAIDPKEPDEQKQLTNIEILDVPYPASQDLRSALPMFQGVVQDISGNPHFNGGASNETNYTLDNFNISDPYTGRLE